MCACYVQETKTKNLMENFNRVCNNRTNTLNNEIERISASYVDCFQSILINLQDLIGESNDCFKIGINFILCFLLFLIVTILFSCCCCCYWFCCSCFRRLRRLLYQGIVCFFKFLECSLRLIECLFHRF